MAGLRQVKLGVIDDKLAKKDGAASSAEVRVYWTKQGFDLEKDLCWSSSN